MLTILRTQGRGTVGRILQTSHAFNANELFNKTASIGGHNWTQTSILIRQGAIPRPTSFSEKSPKFRSDRRVIVIYIISKTVLSATAGISLRLS